MLTLALAVLCGCQTAESKRKKQLARLGLYLEVNPDATQSSEPVPIYRGSPVIMNVQKQPFLGEKMIKEAKVIDVVGGFALVIQFDRKGTWLLEQYTGANRSRHFAIFSQWVQPPSEELNNGRWLAAPKIADRITDGLVSFTPDATREEADQIALGLNNLATKLETNSKWNW
jgi:hypothetical protein